MDEARKQLRQSILAARNTYRRTEARQRQRIKRLQSRIERRTVRALQGVYELLDFDPTRDLKAGLDLPCPTEDSPAPKTAGPSGPALATGNKPAVSRKERRAGTSARRVTTNLGNHPAHKRRPGAGKPEAHRKPPSPDSHATSTSAKRVSRTAEDVTAKPGGSRTKLDISQRQDTEQKVAGAAAAAATRTRHEAPLSESTDKKRQPKPSLAERRRQWSRSRRDEQTTKHARQIERGTGVEQSPPDSANNLPKPERQSVRDKSRPAALATGTATTEHRARQARIETVADPRPPAVQDPQTATTTAQAGVRIDPIETESVNPADDRQAPSQQNESRDFASQGDEIGLVRELCETVYLHGIDRT